MPFEAAQFAAYPPLAKKTAVEHLAVLNSLPPAFAPFLLKETISFDWKFPAERSEIAAQYQYLGALASADLTREMAPFAGLRLSPELQYFDAVNKPGEFLEKLSAHLWATSQMDTFRSASERYMQSFRKAHPEPAPAMPRLAVVLIGQGVSASHYPVFRKLRREGTHFRQVDDSGGLAHVFELLQARAAAHTEPYAHWFIDGAATPFADDRLAVVSYSHLSGIRTALTATISRAFEARTSPETLRTTLAEMTPEKLGIKSSGDPLLDRFHLALFTEGSGTQIYSTTFVQWTTREALRRARPVTLVARYAPRVEEASMRELLNGSTAHKLDPGGSLIDGDMGAWYTWIGLQRLTGADHSNFLVWFEDHREAVAVGPDFTRGKEDSSLIRLDDLLQRLNHSSQRVL